MQGFEGAPPDRFIHGKLGTKLSAFGVKVKSLNLKQSLCLVTCPYQLQEIYHLPKYKLDI